MVSGGCRENMDEYYEVDGGRYCEKHVGVALGRSGSLGGRAGAGGTGGGLGANLSAGGGLGAQGRAEKRRTRLVELPVGGFGA